MSDKKIYLVGIGTGVYEGLTIRAAKLVNAGDLLFGAERMLKAAEGYQGKRINAYQPEEICRCLKSEENKEWKQACVLLSGDVGFYSGAKKLLEALSDYTVELVPGISSISAFCAAIGISWETVSAVSLHGRQRNIIGQIDTEQYTFCLLGGAQGLRELADKLLYYDFEHVILHIGENIGYPEQKIVHITPQEVSGTDFGNLFVAIIENPSPRTCVFPEIDDSEWVRGDVPMTKSEVRSIGIQKLGLSKHSVLYDIGAGTGSVGIQAAVCYPHSSVYAIDYKEAAIDLMTQNQKKFRADNLHIVLGKAPEILETLPTATHAFIGGSAGNMKAIFSFLWEKNPHTVIVMSLITLETLSEVMQLAEEYGIEPQVVQIGVSKSKKTGNYHLMTGQNPVTLVRLIP
jgi:precorrin-6y C5,15-methyltransferase (decarboxylating), CbiE subunit/precorrin-6Y C5,15-methyltransferase (decarboxylating), CbiT subunit